MIEVNSIHTYIISTTTYDFASAFSKIATYSNYYLHLDFDSLLSCISFFCCQLCGRALHLPQVFLQFVRICIYLEVHLPLLLLSLHHFIECLSLHPKEKIEKLTISKMIKTFIIAKMTGVVSSNQSWSLIFNNLHKRFNIC